MRSPFRRTPLALAVALGLALPAISAGPSAVAAAGPAGGGAVPSAPTWSAKAAELSRHPAVARDAVTSAGVAVRENVDVSREPGPQSETSIAVDPRSRTHLVAGSNEIDRLPMRGYFSADDGRTWGAVDLPLPAPLTSSGTRFGSDPGVAWDTRHRAYYTYIVVFFTGDFSRVTGTEMAVARSTDNGRHWTPTYFNFHRGSTVFNDKPMITVDDNPGSPFRDTVYVSWDTAAKSADQNVVLTARSTDGGRTFGAPVRTSPVPAPNNPIGADPFVGPGGVLYVAWHDTVAPAIKVARSTDGGRSFGAPRTVAPTRKAFQMRVPAERLRGELIYPACAADRSHGSRRGNVYCSWSDLTTSSGADVFAAASTDGGRSWGPRVRVEDDAVGVSNDQFNQWLAVDPVTGDVDVSWTDTRGDRSRKTTNEYIGTSADGRRFRNAPVSSARTNETCCGAQLHDQYGDYQGLDAFGGEAHPVWTDRRRTVSFLNEEVFTARVLARR